MKPKTEFYELKNNSALFYEAQKCKPLTPEETSDLFKGSLL